MSDDEDDDLFGIGGGSDSDDTAELIANSKQKSKPKAASKPKAKPKPEAPDKSGLFDSSDEEDEDDAATTKKKKMAALVAKNKKKQEANKPKKIRKKGEKGKKGDGYTSGDSYGSENFERNVDDDNFIDTAGDEEGVNELYSEQNFDNDERPDKKLKKKRRMQPGGGGEPENPVEAVMDRMKKKKREAPTNDMVEEAKNTLFKKMDDAADKDLQAIAERRPALAKLNFLREACETMARKDLEGFLLDQDLLIHCKRWIEPLPNGQLGNITVRQTIIEAVAKLPVEIKHLRDSGFGRAIMTLNRHPKETLALKRLTQTLVETWSRPIFKKSCHLKDLERAQRPMAVIRSPEPAAPSRKAKKQDMDSLIAHGKKATAAGTTRVAVPYGKGFDFQVRPASRTTTGAAGRAVGGGGGGSDIRSQIGKRMVEKGRTAGKNQRSGKISVEGRATKG